MHEGQGGPVGGGCLSTTGAVRYVVQARKRTNFLGVASIVLVGMAVAVLLYWLLTANEAMAFALSLLPAAACVGLGFVSGVVGLLAGVIGGDRELVTPTVGLVGVSALVTVWASSSPGYTEFFLFGGRYRPVVKRIRYGDLRPGEERHFVLEHPWDAGSLRPFGPDETRCRGDGRGHVWASRTADGEYRVAILVEDWGHAGVFGYLYWEGEPPEIHGDSHFELEAPGPMDLVDKRVAVHWWSVYYNLD